jgi:hypothetical protein
MLVLSSMDNASLAPGIQFAMKRGAVSCERGSPSPQPSPAGGRGGRTEAGEGAARRWESQSRAGGRGSTTQADGDAASRSLSPGHGGEGWGEGPGLASLSIIIHQVRP